VAHALEALALGQGRAHALGRAVGRDQLGVGALELDQLTAESETAIENMERGRTASTRIQESDATIDVGEITALAGAHLAMEMLYLYACRAPA